MKRLQMVILKILVVVLVIGTGSVTYSSFREEDYQADADKKRIYDVHQIAALVDEYHREMGKYPLQRLLDGKEVLEVVIVRSFEEFDLQPPRGQSSGYKDEFLSELRSVLGEDVFLPYDPQLKPLTFFPMYQYTLRRNGIYYISTSLYSPYAGSKKLRDHYYKYQITSPNNRRVHSPGIRTIQSVPDEEMQTINVEGVKATNKFRKIFEKGHVGSQFELR